MSVSEAEITVEHVSRVLNEHYIYPEAAKAIEIFIKPKMSTGKYQHVSTQRELIVG